MNIFMGIIVELPLLRTLHQQNKELMCIALLGDHILDHTKVCTKWRKKLTSQFT